jgi:hypothetical protein
VLFCIDRNADQGAEIDQQLYGAWTRENRMAQKNGPM